MLLVTTRLFLFSYILTDETWTDWTNPMYSNNAILIIDVHIYVQAFEWVQNIKIFYCELSGVESYNKMVKMTDTKLQNKQIAHNT